jgi:hypothetical protein
MRYDMLTYTTRWRIMGIVNQRRPKMTILMYDYLYLQGDLDWVLDQI